MNRMILLIRREFWEHRAFLIAPAIVAAILLMSALFPNVNVGDLDLDTLEETRLFSQHAAIVTGILGVFAAFFFVVMGVVAVFYLLDSLHSDRKDRSVLFWKSLPVSDAATVTSKLATAALAIPLWTWVAALAGNVLFALVLSTRLSIMSSTNLWPVIWNPAAWFGAHALVLYAVLAGVLWYLPVMGWLLLVSAYAKRAVMLWAALPPLMLMFCERLLFDTSHVSSMLVYRLVGWFDLAFRDNPERHIVIDGERVPWSVTPDLIGYLSNPDLWIGLVVAAAFVWCAVLIRRHRTEI